MLYGLLAVVLMAMDHRGKYVPKVRSIAENAVEPFYHLVEWPVTATRDLVEQFESRKKLRLQVETLQEQLLLQRPAAEAG